MGSQSCTRQYFNLGNLLHIIVMLHSLEQNVQESHLFHVCSKDSNRAFFVYTITDLQ